ncbi:hypothetical protein B6S12_10085 [Helicobacter valdiviensis]|uniref:Phosphoadenosine phosphosulphate reductase domain-containing protein n=1 Tax=Helicobacter valdiviensis TaxID=1458358 RepID=A0A2W6MRQ5_9HELI|nr:phosphoadenosine phosphosulfate reductase family protein [Helicobacter valdiviensis]PZT47244.1 hypothetical protein B6S12_10085 [Helicobacter valdiviensis]
MTFANLSGGRDSTAMVINYLESGKDIDYILFCDTHYEFKEMYEYIDRIENYLKKKFNKTLARLKSKEDLFYKWAFLEPISRGERKGELRGLPLTLGMSFCTRELKSRPSEKFIKEKCPNSFKCDILIGYTHSEVKSGRVSNLSYGVAKYPLHEWGWNEKECEDFLKERGIANPLYKYFERTGCFFCPKQSKASLYNLFKFFPKEWQKCKDFESLAKSKGCLNQTFKPNMTLEKLELDFKKNPKLDLSEDYKSDEVCFCR